MLDFGGILLIIVFLGFGILCGLAFVEELRKKNLWAATMSFLLATVGLGASVLSAVDYRNNWNLLELRKQVLARNYETKSDAQSRVGPIGPNYAVFWGSKNLRPQSSIIDSGGRSFFRPEKIEYVVVVEPKLHSEMKVATQLVRTLQKNITGLSKTFKTYELEFTIIDAKRGLLLGKWTLFPDPFPARNTLRSLDDMPEDYPWKRKDEFIHCISQRPVATCSNYLRK